MPVVLNLFFLSVQHFVCPISSDVPVASASSWSNSVTPFQIASMDLMSSFVVRCLCFRFKSSVFRHNTLQLYAEPQALGKNIPSGKPSESWPYTLAVVFGCYTYPHSSIDLCGKRVWGCSMAQHVCSAIIQDNAIIAVVKINRNPSVTSG